jgi:hypothetical protein
MIRYNRGELMNEEKDVLVNIILLLQSQMNDIAQMTAYQNANRRMPKMKDIDLAIMNDICYGESLNDD